MRVSDTTDTKCEVALPSGISRVGLSEAFRYGEGRFERFERRRPFALGKKHVADFVVRDGKIALPSSISRVGLGKALGYGK